MGCGSPTTPPCSLQHGQKITGAPQALLAKAGFTVVLPAESHLCCGSAGVYNILQPEIAGQLGARKMVALEAVRPEVIATGNVGMVGNAAVILLPALAVQVYFMSGTLREAARYLAVAAVVTIIVIAPLAIRNHQVFGAYVLNNGGGVNLYLGNNELSTPVLSACPGIAARR